MKITPERLSELDASLPKSADESPISEYNTLYGSEEAKELLRLARLGMWADQFGIKVIEAVDDNESLIDDGYASLVYLARTALKASPSREQ